MSDEVCLWTSQGSGLKVWFAILVCQIQLNSPQGPLAVCSVCVRAQSWHSKWETNIAINTFSQSAQYFRSTGGKGEI